MNRNILKLLFSAAFVMCCTFSALADLGTPPDNQIWYTTDNNSKLTAGKYDVGKPLCGTTISEHGESDGYYYIRFNANIEYIGENDFDNEDHITEVSLPNTITSIRDKAFNDCDGLVTFHMPNSVINLGYCAFYHCDKLKNLTLGSGLKYIGAYNESYGVFEECDALEAVAIPASVTLLGRNAFYDCDSLKFVAIGSGVTSITEQAFYNCDELMSVAIDGNGVSIGEDAFNDCEKLESVSFFGNTPPSSFGDDCFYDCSPSLKYHVLEEDYGKYNSNSYLSGKVVAGPPYNEIWYSTNNGGTAGRSDLLNYRPKLNAYMGSHGVVFFDGNPPELNSDHYYFGYCTNLVSAVLPSSITYIGKYAFSDCSSLVSVSIPSTVKGIGEHAFHDCYNLQNIKLPDGLNDIGYKAFESCYLRSITIPSGVNNISLEAFSFCSQLRSVTILGTIQNIYGKAFGACYNLSEIYYLGDGTPECDNSIDYNSFKSCYPTIYVKDVAGHGNWGDRPVRSWRPVQGDGSAASPLEIGNYQQLYGFSLEVEYMNGANLCAKLTADITGSNNVLNEDGTPKGVFKQWLPIGSWGSVPNTYNGYTGEFDGGGHTVSGLYFNDVTKAPAGLFGMADGAYIHDVGVKDSYFRGKSHVAGICGDLANGKIENCWNAATVQAANGTAGGMAGSCWRSAYMSSCHNTGKVAEGAFCGGVCGSVAKNTAGVTYSVSNCVSLEGKCSVAYYLYESGVGINNVSIKNAAAFASGEVCYILNGYQTSFSNKWRQQLGVDGYPILSGDYFVYYNATSQSYYNHDEDISGSGTADDPYRIGNKFELLKFANIVNTQNTEVCGILTADITMNTGVLDSDGNPNSGTFEAWTPIGRWGSEAYTYNGYSGEFNGNGHTISGLYFNDENRSAVGLFGMADNNGYIHDVGIKDSYFRGKSHVAGICGDLGYGRIENCWNAATVTGTIDCVGGITGSCYIPSSVSGCYNIGKISSINSNVCGGICGSVAKNPNVTYSVSNCVSLEGKCGVAYNIGEEGVGINNVFNDKDATAFASGEVCWILNGSQPSDKWRQQLGVDDYPTLSGDYFVYYNAGTNKYYNYDNNISGSGTADDPYRIGNWFELLMFADIVNNGNTSACGILTADITMNTGVLDSDGNPNSGTFEPWTPIGGEGYGYKGEFNGNGHIISGLYFGGYTKDRVGLFGKTGDNAYIHDLGIKDSYFYGNSWVAGICSDFASGRIENCWNAATVFCVMGCAGGIAASCGTGASMTGCYNIGKLRIEHGDYSQCGGICGTVARNDNVEYSVSNCVSLKGKCDKAYNLYEDGVGINNVFNDKDAEAFASGEVCWILNGNKYGGHWCQQLGTDAYPTFSGIYFVNYTSERQYYNNEPTQEIWYTSTDGKIVTPYNSNSFGAGVTCNTYGNGQGVITFDRAVTSIGGQAFRDRSSLQSATISNSVTSIGEYAFSGCSSLQEINIPSGVTSIGKSAFSRCESLRSVSILSDSKLTSIGEYAFEYCSLLKEINIPSGVTSIGKYAFANCKSLTTITFNSLPVLGTYAFYPCANLNNRILDLTDSDKPYIGNKMNDYHPFTEAHYHGTLEPGEWGTITLPFVPSSHPGIVFFSIDNVDAANGTLTLSVAENIEAGKPYLFRNQTDAASFTLTAMPAAPATNVPVNITASEQTVGDFALKGTFQAKNLTETGLYQLDGDAFVHAGSLSINPFHAYLKDNGGSGVEHIVIDGGTLVKITNQDDSTITLNGLKEVEFIEENGTPAVRVTYKDGSTKTYTNPKKVEFGK